MKQKFLSPCSSFQKEILIKNSVTNVLNKAAKMNKSLVITKDGSRGNCGHQRILECEWKGRGKG